MRRALATLFLLLMAATGVLAQDEGEDDNGFIINLLEDKLSTETRKIRLSGVEGVLSRRATVKLITISDPDGIWLQIDEALIDWNRSALLRGRVEVNTIAAKKITFSRPPVPDPSALPDPGARSFEVPELPVSVRLDELDIEEIVLGEPLLGREARVSAAGSMSIADGSMEAKLDMTRLDGAGGEFALSASFANETSLLDLNLRVSEPQGGVFATLLGLDGAPPLETSIIANGTLDDLSAELDFVADGEDLLDGVVKVGRTDGLLGFEADFVGRLRPMLPAQFHGFFAERSTISAAGQQRSGGGFRVDRFAVDSGGLTLSGAVSTAADGFPDGLELTADLAASAEAPLALPVGGPVTTVTGGQLRLNYGDGDRWDGLLSLSDLKRGGVSIGNSRMTMEGEASNLSDPATRRITASLAGTMQDMTAEDPRLRKLLEGAVELTLDAAWRSGRPVDINEFSLSGAGSAVRVEGAFGTEGFKGLGDVDITQLGVFAPLTGRDLGGAIDIIVEGEVNPLTGAFAMDIDGNSTDLVLGVAALDRVMGGRTTLSGGVARNVDGIRADNLRLVNDRVELSANGRYATDGTDLTAAASLRDLADLTPRARGAATVDFNVQGDSKALDIALELNVPEGQLVDRQLRDALVRIDATRGARGLVRGRLNGTGALGASEAALSGYFETSAEVQRLKQFTFTLGPSTLEGTVARGADGLFSGTVEIDSPDLTELAAIALIEGRGAADLKLVLSRQAGKQSAQVAGFLQDFAAAGQILGRADMDLTFTDLFGLPLADGYLTAERAQIMSTGISRFALSAERADGDMALRLSTELDNGTRARLGGNLQTTPEAATVRLEELEVTAASSQLRLFEPSVLELRRGQVSLSPTTLRIGDGLITARARVAEILDIDIQMDQVPMNIANAFVPEQSVEGLINGSVTVSGTPAQPVVQFDVTADDVSAQVLRESRLPPMQLAVRGETRDEMLDMSAEMIAGDILDARLAGFIPFDPARPAMNLRLQLLNLDLSILDRFAPDQGIDGSAGGSVVATGSLEDPSVELSLNMAVQNNLMRDLGLQGSNVNLEAGYRDGIVTLQSARADSGGDLRFSASGVIPLSGPGLDVNVEGRAPLVLANVLLAQTQSQIQGLARTAFSVSGQLDAPRFDGQLNVEGAQFASQQLNITLEDLDVAVQLDGNTARITSARARLARGGDVQLQGSVEINPNSGFPSDLALTLRRVRYTDGNIVKTRGDADLRLTGPILRRPSLSGEIRLAETEVSIPRSFGIDRGLLLDVKHRNPPRDVRMTLDRAALRNGGDRLTPKFDMGLDLTISSPRRLFIRGRGLDTEMGGQIRLRGSLSNLVPVGQIELIRGRLGILGKRIDFDEGSVTLTGTLDPKILLVAETVASDGTLIVITVAGSASDPEITFTAVPELPQDEVLAQLIFDRSLAELSPFQIAQLAAAAATLAGSGGGLTDDFRASTGLANLDLTTSEDGQVGVRAGAYIDDNIYLDVETESDGDSRATINLDITKNLRGRVSVDSEGESKIGIFYERDY